MIKSKPIEEIKQIRPPITYFGSKAEMATWICSYFPSHKTYVEPFGGSASVLLAKKPSSVEVYNDINDELVNLFEVLRDKASYKKLVEILKATPFSRREFVNAKKITDDPIESARRFMIRQRQSHSGRGENWSYSVADSVIGMSSAVRRWLAGIERLPEIHKRMMRVQIESLDWREILKKYDADKTLFYLDPPYIMETRVNGGYKHELDDFDHEDLVKLLIDVKGMVILSGYKHPIYEPLIEQAGWKAVERSVIAKSSSNRTERTEVLWISPNAIKQKNTGILKEGIEQNDLFNSPSEMMRLGAYHVHEKRVCETTARIQKEIEAFKRVGKKPSKTKIAESLNLSREHLTRKYGHLF